MAQEKVWTGSRPIWIASAVLTLVTWPQAMGLAGAGLDFSWMGGLYMAANEGKHFGTEVVFTYGPLGFLDWPALWFNWLAFLAFFVFCVTYLTLTTLLTWSIARNAGLVAAGVVVFVSLTAYSFLGDMPLIIGVGLAFVALREERPRSAVTVLMIGGGILCAIEPLAKLSVGPPTALIIVLAMIGARADRRRWAGFVAISVIGFFAGWFLTGQGLGNLPDYVRNGIQIISGYNEAMGFDAAETWEAVALIVFAIALVAGIHRACFRDARAKFFATGVAAVATYVIFKYGTTQFGKGGPPVVALTTFLAIFMMAPWPRRLASIYLVATAVFVAIIVHAFPATASFDVISKMETFKEAAELEVRPGLRQAEIDGSRASLQQSLAVPQHVLEVIGQEPVAIEPWEISVAWAYGLNWRPLPVFQSYSAYTEKLDRLNAESIEDAEGGPQMLLRQITGSEPGQGRPPFLNRFSLWDPPAQNVATVCDFVPILTEGNWQVLKRIPDRCGKPEMISQATADEGQPVKVPLAGRDQLTVMQVKGAKIEGLEKLGSLFWRPKERRIVLEDGKFGYRLIPGTSEDGLIVSVDQKLDRGMNLTELGTIHNLAIEGAGGSLEYSFYRINLQRVNLIPVKKPEGTEGPAESGAGGGSG